MIDREYKKLNTSIQTGSNAQQLLHDADGNVEATVELRLPENIFAKSDGEKKVDSVMMQTSKFRLSMENTPIAQLPVDTELTTRYEKPISACQLDVYPFCLQSDNQLLPLTLGETSFPYYKDHTVELDYTEFLNDYEEEIAEGEAIKQLKRLTKDELLRTAGKCFRVVLAYLDIREKINALGSVIEIITDENKAILDAVKSIEAQYEEAEKINFKPYAKATEALDNTLRLLPDKIWVE